MRNISVLPEIDRVIVSIGKYFSNINEFNIELIEKKDYYCVYKILGDTTEIDGKNILFMLLNGYEDSRTSNDDLFDGLDIPQGEIEYESYRESSYNSNYTHLFPPIELLTADEYVRNPFRFKNFRLQYNDSWKIVVDGNLVGKGYILYQSNDYFDCLNNIEKMVGPEFSDSTKYYVINEYGHYEYFEDINKAIDLYANLFQQRKYCVLGTLLKFKDYTYYSNQEVDLPIVKPSGDFREHIYIKKVEDQAYFRANPVLIKAINTIIQRIMPTKMIDMSVNNSKVTTFNKSFLMYIADKEKKVR